jgi:steroid 5-alpha reductase family enzyme
MREEREDSWWWYSYVTVFLPHALIAWVVSLPLYFAIVSLVPSTLTAFDSLGVMLIVIGLFFEIVSDEHLRRFRNVAGSHTRVLDTGLWRYSRHPNYFGEAIIWWGFGMIGVATGGVPGLIGPVLITFLLIRVTGVPLLESAMVETKPGYAEYASRTSVFFPMPPQPKGSAPPPAPAVQQRRPNASDRLRRK